MMRQWIVGKQFFLAPAAVAFSLLAGAAHAAGAPQPTRTSLTVDAANARTTLTAHVTDAFGGSAGNGGAGTVSFEIAAGSLGSALVDANGDASLTLDRELARPANIAAGTIRAVFHPLAGNESLAASASAPLPLQPSASAVPDFTLTANPSTVSTTVGLYATTAITVTPQNGFSEQVTLSCNNLPAQVTCNFSPIIQSTAQGAFTSTLQLQTQIGSGSLTQPDFGQHSRGSDAPGTALAWLLPGALALLGVGAMRRKAGLAHSAGVLLLVLLLTAGAAGLVGCSQRYGYLHHPPIAAGGTPKGTYSIDVSAGGNDGSAVTTHDVTVMLQVQ